MVFNPSSNPRTDLVNVEISLPAGVEAFDLVDEAGATIPHESLGIESADLANLILDRKGLREAMTMVNDGRVSGMGVQSFSTQRDGETLHLELLLSDGEPNNDAWQRGLKETAALLEDETSDILPRPREGASLEQDSLSCTAHPGTWISYFSCSHTQPA